MGGAYPVTVRDRRQPLNVRPKEFRKQLSLDIAQLREDLSHLRYRAIMLADLLPRTSWLDGGHIAVGRQYLSQQLSRDFVGARLTQRSVTRLDVIDSSLSHRVKSRGARCIGKLSKGRYRQVVVGSVIVGTPVIGQEEDAGRSAPSASSKDLLLTGIDKALTHKSAEMATYRRRCQTKTIGQFAGVDGPLCRMDDITRSLVGLSTVSCLCSPTMSRPATATSVSVEFFTTPLLPKRGLVQVSQP